jgi:hypothetical protein
MPFIPPTAILLGIVNATRLKASIIDPERTYKTSKNLTGSFFMLTPAKDFEQTQSLA